jgi:hypothetical protein
MKANVTPASIAAALNQLEYGYGFPPDEVQEQARAAVIVIACCESDDLMAFYGAFRDEKGVYGGDAVLIDAKGVLPTFEEVNEDEDASRDYFERKPKARAIKAHWLPKDGKTGKPWASWACETDIPHETFDVMEDGGIYCRGIVFSLADMAAPSKA